MRTNVYIDGFNLYNRRLKRRPDLKWLNLKLLADSILRAPMVVQRVNYYTARVSGHLDADAPRRQQLYLDALATVPEISIYFGNFLFTRHWAALARPPDARPRGYKWNMPVPDLVWVQKVEEKGSDVNLGVHLVRDAMSDAFDRAIILTNDTDLAEPMRIVREVGKSVGLLSPVETKQVKGRWQAASSRLTVNADFTLYIHNRHLLAAQFPNALGSVTRPQAWV